MRRIVTARSCRPTLRQLHAIARPGCIAPGDVPQAADAQAASAHAASLQATLDQAADDQAASDQAAVSHVGLARAAARQAVALNTVVPVSRGRRGSWSSDGVRVRRSVVVISAADAMLDVADARAPDSRSVPSGPRA